MKRPKCALLKSRVVSLLHTLLTALMIWNFTIRGHRRQGCLEVWPSPSASPWWAQGPAGHLSFLVPQLMYSEVVFDTFKELPGLLVPCCAVPPTDIRGVKVPHENQNLRAWCQSYLPTEGFIHTILLLGQSVADPHSSISCPCLPFNADPQTLSTSSFPSQGSIHSGWSLRFRATLLFHFPICTFLKSLKPSISMPQL